MLFLTPFLRQAGLRVGASLCSLPPAQGRRGQSRSCLAHAPEPLHGPACPPQRPRQGWDGSPRSPRLSPRAAAAVRPRVGSGQNQAPPRPSHSSPCLPRSETFTGTRGCLCDITITSSVMKAPPPPLLPCRLSSGPRAAWMRQRSREGEGSVGETQPAPAASAISGSRGPGLT